MKRLLVTIAILICTIWMSRGIVRAQTASRSGMTNITVTVAGYQLSVSGYVAPFASISLTINGNIITSTTADSQGNFIIKNILIPKTTSMICFDVVDYKNLGQSEACISVAPVNGVVTKTNIFLPPTLGIQRTEVLVGDSALAFGYGMPGATITVHISGINGCIVVADSNGYYQCSITIRKAETYELYADAILNGKPSEIQLKRILLKGIAQVKVPTLAPVPSFFPGLPNLFAIPWWIWLLLVLIAIIPIIILLRRYLPQPLSPVNLPKGTPISLKHAFDFLLRERRLHHWWMQGVGF